MAKKGSTSINIKVVANAGQGGSGKSQQHNIRAIGLGHESVKTQQVIDGKLTTVTSSHHILEDLMIKHFADKDMYNMPPEERKYLNRKFMDDVNAALSVKGVTEVIDKDDKMVMDHVDPSLTPNNDFLIIQPLEKYLDNVLRPLVKEKTGQRMQDICTPYKEGVIVIKSDTSIEDLKVFAEEVKKEIGWSPMQIYIHHDEGHIDKQTGEWKENHHAHIVFDTINHDTGKTIQVNRLGLANMQTILSQTIGMERGENSSDLAHLNSLEFKAQMEQANMRFNLSLSVANIGQDPRKMMANAILSTIDAMPIDKPNDRNTINLLRVVGKDLNVNPTKQCAEAIFEELRKNPDMIIDIAENLKINVRQVSHEELSAVIHEKLLATAVWCGKTEKATDFRPLLKCAKDLNLDLIPVMLNPIKESVNQILTSPIDRDNNNMLWCASDRCKINTQEMLQQAQSEGIQQLKEQVASVVATKEVAERKVEVISDTVKSIIEFSGEQVDYSASVKDNAMQAVSIVKDMRYEVKSLNDEKSEIQQQISDDMANVRYIAGYTDNKLIADALIKHIERVKDLPSEQVTKQLSMGYVDALLYLQQKPAFKVAQLIENNYSGIPERTHEAMCKKLSLPADATGQEVCSELYNQSFAIDRKQISFSSSFLGNIIVPKALTDILYNDLKSQIQLCSNKGGQFEEQYYRDRLDNIAKCLGIDTKRIVLDASIDIKSAFEKNLEEGRTNEKLTNEVLSQVKSFVKENIHGDLKEKFEKDNVQSPQLYLVYASEIMAEQKEFKQGMKDTMAAFERGVNKGKVEVQGTLVHLEDEIKDLKQNIKLANGNMHEEKKRADKAEKQLDLLKDIVVKIALENPAIKKLYDAGLQFKDSVIELYATMKTKFTGLLNYAGMTLRCNNNELSIKKDDPDPYIDNQNINQVVGILKDMNIKDEEIKQQGKSKGQHL